MGDPIGAVISIAGLLKRAYDLYDACSKAAEEFKTASRQVHSMTIVLEGVRSDLINNKRSAINRGGDIAKNKSNRLKTLLAGCSVSLGKLEALLKKYNGLRNNSSAWDSFRWGNGGKAEIKNMQADLVVSMVMLNTFLQSEGLDALGRLEQAMEMLMRKFDSLEMPRSQTKSRGDTRRRSSDGVGRCLIAGFFISRLLARIRSRKPLSRKNTMARSKGGVEKIRPTVRVKSGLSPNKKRDSLLQS
ncbi:hypothetical protein K432DRAFT_248863, partial [Lepidopterella palustris CBS 459.81]